MNGPNVGKKAIFHNLYAYPSLHGKRCVISSDCGEGELHRYGVKFEDPELPQGMAASESEVTIQNEND